jgi:hypothetical protein
MLTNFTVKYFWIYIGQMVEWSAYRKSSLLVYIGQFYKRMTIPNNAGDLGILGFRNSITMWPAKVKILMKNYFVSSLHLLIFLSGPPLYSMEYIITFCHGFHMERVHYNEGVSFHISNMDSDNLQLRYANS